MSRTNLFIVLTSLAVGAVGYFAFGNPGMADRPMSDRQQALKEKARTDPTNLTPAEMLSSLELATQDQPDAPEPHYFIGDFLRQQNRLQDAARAYQSALRRDETFVPALIALGDVQVQQSSDGRINDYAMRLYGQAYALDSTQTRAGYLAGLGALQSGDIETAKQAWATLLDGIAEDDPARGMLDAQMQLEFSRH